MSHALLANALFANTLGTTLPSRYASEIVSMDASTNMIATAAAYGMS